jgi:speckle-type POZ protein
VRCECDVTVLKEIRTEGTSQFVMVPPSDMNQHIGRLLSLGVEGDIIFQVGEETFTAHRLVLGARSSVFMAELLGPMKERKSCIQIDDMDPRVFKAMLHFIYTDSLPEMQKGDSYVMAQHLLVAADRYGLERLKLICEDKLCNYINTNIGACRAAWLQRAQGGMLQVPQVSG